MKAEIFLLSQWIDIVYSCHIKSIGEQHDEKNGLVLMEVVILTAVLGLVAALVIPRFTEVSRYAKAAQVQVNLTSLRTAINMYHSKTGTYPMLTNGTTNFLDEVEVSGVKFTDFYSKNHMPYTPSFDDSRGFSVETTNKVVQGERSDGINTGFTGEGGWLTLSHWSAHSGDPRQGVYEIYANVSAGREFDPFYQDIEWTEF